MRLAVVVLVVLGLVAAVCAVLLIQVVAGPKPVVQTAAKDEAEADVIIASRALPMMTLVDGKALTNKRVPKSQVPKGALLSSVQVVGKILTRPMVEGEPFTESCFATEGVGFYLAEALPDGKRAVSVQF